MKGAKDIGIQYRLSHIGFDSCYIFYFTYSTIRPCLKGGYSGPEYRISPGGFVLMLFMDFGRRVLVSFLQGMGLVWEQHKSRRHRSSYYSPFVKI